MQDIFYNYKNFKSVIMGFIDGNFSQQKFICSIDSVDAEFIVLSIDIDEEKKFPVVGEEIILNVYSDEGIYTANSKILKKIVSETQIFYTISYPVNCKHSQRREYFRAKLHIPFVITVDNNQKISGVTKNICGKGICYNSYKPFPLYENSLKIDMDFEGRIISTFAELVYSKTLVEDNKPKFVHAFTLTTISNDDVGFIVDKCFKSNN